METRAQGGEVSSLRSLSQRMSHLGFKSRPPDFSICPFNHSVRLPLSSTPSNGGQRTFSPSQKTKFQAPKTRGDCHFPAQSLPRAHPLPAGQCPGSLTCHPWLPHIRPLFCCSPKLSHIPSPILCSLLHFPNCSPWLKLYSLFQMPLLPLHAW